MLIMLYYLYSLTTVIHDQTQNITQIGIRLKRNIHPTIHYWSSVDDKLTYPNQNEIQQAAPALTTSPNQQAATAKFAPTHQPNITELATERNSFTLSQRDPSNTTQNSSNHHENSFEEIGTPSAIRDLEPAKKMKDNIRIIPSGHQINSGNYPSGGTKIVMFYILYVFSHNVHPANPHAIVLSLLLVSPVSPQSIIGYDTAGRFSEKKVTMKTISLLGVESCDQVQSRSYLPPVDHEVQVLYQPSESTLTVLQCSIKISTEVLHCEHSIFRADIYPPDIIAKDQIIPISEKECRDIHINHYYDLRLYGKTHRISDIIHTPQTVLKTLTGTKRPDGGCTGGSIEIGNLKRDNVVARMTLVSYVKELEARYSPSSNLIFVGDLVSFTPGGSKETSCDSYYGCFYTALPNIIPKNTCEQTEQFLKGNAKLFQPNATPGQQQHGYMDIIQISSGVDNTQGTTLTLHDTVIVCNTVVRRTNIPRLFVNFFNDGGDSRPVTHRLSNHTITDKNSYKLIDILTSSSNIYLRGTLSISEQFDKVSYRLCELRRAALLAILRDLLTSGAAPLLNYREGILFQRIGSVAYIFLGVPIQAKLRHTEECYNEIPISLTHNEREIFAFATSKGRIIVSNGTRVKCSNRSPMHFIRNEIDEVARLNRSLDLFPDLAFSSEINEIQSPGSWLCQLPGKFIACEIPSSLSPLIGTTDHFLGIQGRFLQQSIFGHQGRQELYLSQTEGYNREVVLSQITHGSDGAIGSTASELLIDNLSEVAKERIRMIILPTFYFFFGSFITYMEQLLLSIFIISIIINLANLASRLVTLFKHYGFSRYLSFAFIEGMYNAIIPWRSASIERKRAIKEMKTLLEAQNAKHVALEVQVTELRTLVLQPFAIHQSAPQSPNPIRRGAGESPIYPRLTRQYGLNHELHRTRGGNLDPLLHHELLPMRSLTFNDVNQTPNAPTQPDSDEQRQNK